MTTAKMAIRALFAAFPNVEVKEETIAVYLRLLAHIPPELLQACVDQAISTHPYATVPTIAEILEIHTTMTTPAQLSAADAWGMVQQEIRRVGSYGVPVFADANVAACVKSLGWKYLCGSEDGMADRAHFMKMYDELARRSAAEVRTLPQVKQLAAALQMKRLETNNGAQ